MAENPKSPDEIFAYFDEKAPVIFLTLSTDGKIIGANRFADKLTGRSLIGENFREVIVDFTGKFDLAAVVDDASTERLINVGNASGLPQSFYFTFKPVSDTILAFGRLDAEELENMRREVLSLNQELNNLMRELHKTNAKLKLLNEEKNRFLGMAAHDLRKPIGLVLTYSEFIMQEAQSALDAEHLGFLKTINRSCSFMKRLVDDFLDVSAIEAGKFELDLRPASIKQALSHSLQLNNLQATIKGVGLEVSCEEGLPPMVMDAPKIEQAITNLVSNAIEHTGFDTAVAVTLSQKDGSIIFSVQDSGPGIAPEEMDKIFRPFEKTSTKKTAGEKSTGLGMLITRKIIETHGGKMWIASQVGMGTTVYFELPLKEK